MNIKKKIVKLEDKLKKYNVAGSLNDQRQNTKLRNKINKLKARLKNHQDVAMSNRENGTRFEFKLLRKEKRNGLLAMRSAGSHSLVDVLSIKKNGEIHLINAKSHGYHDPDELKKLRELKKLLPSNCIIKLACYSSKKKYTCKTLK
jgi:hypothetical protein